MEKRDVTPASDEAPGSATGSISLGVLTLNFDRFQTTVAGERVDLTYDEFELLALFRIGSFASEESPPIHRCFPVTGFRMRPIARTSSSHRDVCAASCLFPSGLSR